MVFKLPRGLDGHFETANSFKTAGTLTMRLDRIKLPHSFKFKYVIAQPDGLQMYNLECLSHVTKTYISGYFTDRILKYSTPMNE